MGRLVPIHEWHIAVHKNQVEVAELVLVALNIGNHFLQSFLAVICFFTNFLGINTYRVLEDDVESINVEVLVINNQNFSLIWQLWRVEKLYLD